MIDITQVTQDAFAAYLKKDPSALSADRYVVDTCMLCICMPAIDRHDIPASD